VEKKTMKKKSGKHEDLHPIDLTANALKGKQSVRVTFRLPEHTIALLSLAASQLGIQQKSLFDQLVEDQEVLNRVADDGQNYSIGEDERVQKTYVISRNSLIALRNIAKENNMSRDLLVELSINRLRPVISAEQERQKKWKILLGKMEELLRHGRLTLSEAADLLNAEDQVFQKIEGLIADLQKGYEEIQQWIKKGNRMEEFK
jgi:hypothetical protein